MIELMSMIEKKASSLNGRTLTDDEMVLLSTRFHAFPWLQALQTILRKYRIIGEEFYISAENDLSGIGVRMQWLTPKEQVEEAFDFYPGMIVVTHGFLPIGKCLSGSGDPYFLRVVDNVWHVYRVLHDFASGKTYDEDMVEYVTSFENLIING